MLRAGAIPWAGHFPFHLDMRPHLFVGEHCKPSSTTIPLLRGHLRSKHPCRYRLSLPAASPTTAGYVGHIRSSRRVIPMTRETRTA